QELPVGDMQIERRERLVGAERLRDLQVANVHVGAPCLPTIRTCSTVARPSARQLPNAGRDDRLPRPPSPRATRANTSGRCDDPCSRLDLPDWNDPISATLTFHSGVVKLTHLLTRRNGGPGLP